LYTVTRMHEVEIVSNRKLVSYGECYVKFCTHRPSRSENLFGWSSKIWSGFLFKTNFFGI